MVPGTTRPDASTTGPALAGLAEEPVGEPEGDLRKHHEQDQRDDLKEGSDEWVTFFDLAAVARQAIPADIMADEGLVKRLPLVFRTLRGQRVSDKHLDALVEKLRKA